MALKSSSNLVWIAEYFVFQERVSISFGFPLHANANPVQITNFKPLRSAILATVEAKIDFLDFLEFKALRAPKTYITFHIYLRAGSHFDISISISMNIGIRKICVNRGYISLSKSISISSRNGTFSIFLCLCL